MEFQEPVAASCHLSLHACNQSLLACRKQGSYAAIYFIELAKHVRHSKKSLKYQFSLRGWWKLRWPNLREKWLIEGTNLLKLQPYYFWNMWLEPKAPQRVFVFYSHFSYNRFVESQQVIRGRPYHPCHGRACWIKLLNPMVQFTGIQARNQETTSG